MTRLTVAPEPDPAAEAEELASEEWLRRMVDVSRQLCDAIDTVLPSRPARPRLTVIDGGKQ